MVELNRPKKIEINNTRLEIDWNDDSGSIISLLKLRQNCPCAFCSADREEQSATYIPLYSDDQLTVEKLELIGKYALGVKWKDGHDTGIYEFDQLKKLS